MLGLLQRTPRFEVLLNRRMPNGTYGGVRGQLILPYSMLDKCDIKEEDIVLIWDTDTGLSGYLVQRL